MAAKLPRGWGLGRVDGRCRGPGASRVDPELVLCEYYAEPGHLGLGDRSVSRYVFGELVNTPD